jgi:hypothetical protein
MAMNTRKGNKKNTFKTHFSYMSIGSYHLDIRPFFGASISANVS